MFKDETPVQVLLRVHKQPNKWPAGVSDPTPFLFHLHSHGEWDMNALSCIVFKDDTTDSDCSIPRVWLRSPIWYPDSFLYFAHMKLVGRLVTAAAFNRACHCLYLCLQNTKWAVARNEPLHFLTTASQIDVSVVSSQMFPSTAMLPNIVLQGWTSRAHFNDTHSFGWGLSTLQWFHNKNEELIPSTYSVLVHCDKWWEEHRQSRRPGQCRLGNHTLETVQVNELGSKEFYKS